MKTHQTKIFTSSFKVLFSEFERIESDHLIFIIDSNVYEIYRMFFEDLNSLSKKLSFWIAPSGESVKNFKSYKDCIEHLIAQGSHRNSHLIAFGGGATSDFAGFVASSLFRGINWSIVATTLLSQVDASIGGKTGINSENGKNLIGAFHFPLNVFVCEDFLKTLEQDHYMSGLGEVAKYAFLDGKIFDAILEREDLSKICHLCAQYKQKIVHDDPYEKDIRKFLNFGHTFGHAYEKLTGLPHGVCVVWGMEFIDKYFLNSRYRDDLALIKDHLNFHYDFFDVEMEELFEMIYSDKKKIANNHIDLILLKQVGHPVVRTFTFDEVRNNLWK